MKEQKINKARAIYYNLFENFFIISPKKNNYPEIIKLLTIVRTNPLNEESGKALDYIASKIENGLTYQEFVIEHDELFYNPTKKINQTMSSYASTKESNKKRLEMINFLAKTKIRRNEKEYSEYEDSFGFICSVMAQLNDLLANDEKEYENLIHCIFKDMINEYADLFAKNVYEHEKADIYKNIAVVLKAFIEFERLYLEIPKIVNKLELEKNDKPEEKISKAEMERRAKNKALKAKGPKKKTREEEEACPVFVASAGEEEV